MYSGYRNAFKSIQKNCKDLRETQILRRFQKPPFALIHSKKEKRSVTFVSRLQRMYHQSPKTPLISTVAAIKDTVTGIEI